MIKIVISTLLLFISVLPAQRLTIVKPTINSNIVPESMVEIEWSYFQVDGNIIISYSKNSGTWGKKEIDIVDVAEKSYSWFVPSINEYDGEIYIRITSEKDKSVNDRMALRLPNYPTKVAKNNSVSRSGSISNKLPWEKEWDSWQTYFRSVSSSSQVYINKAGNLKYGPGNYQIIPGNKKTYYGQRYEYVSDWGTNFVVRSYSNKKIYFIKGREGTIVSKGGYPKTNRNTARSSTSSSYSSYSSTNDSEFFWTCVVYIAGIISILTVRPFG